MTTIAFKDGWLAADTRVSENDIIAGQMTKIVTLPTGEMMAGCGTVSTIHECFDWFLRKPRSAKSQLPSLYEDTSIIIIDAQGRVAEHTASGIVAKIHAPFLAWGTGKDFALGAMAAGKSAAAAIEIACQFDVYSAAPVEAFHPAKDRENTRIYDYV